MLHPFIQLSVGTDARGLYVALLLGAMRFQFCDLRGVRGVLLQQLGPPVKVCQYA